MLQNISQKIALNDGNFMPGYGFGLYKAQGQELIAAVQAAHANGYRLFDTAAFYENEETVGEALSQFDEEDIFLVSKIWPTQFDKPVAALDTSLRKLRRDYLDAYLLHWPGTSEKAMLSAYEKLLREKEKGKIRSLGVSNFLKIHLQNLHEHFDLWAPINQLEIHPRFQQREVCEFCAARQIAVMAWSPLGRGADLENETLVNIAREVNKTAAQVILRWHLQQNRIPIPKSVHAERIAANAEVFDFSLNDKQMQAINDLELPGVAGRRGADPMRFAG